MQVEAKSQLTLRQRAVMELIDRRVPIKLIALELGVTESRINQHIRAIKDIYGAASLNELVRLHREAMNGDDPLPGDFEVEGQGQDDEPVAGVDGAGTLDAVDEPQAKREPRIVPAALDGRHAIPLRLAAIMAIALSVLLVSSLTVSATVLVSRAFAGTVKTAQAAAGNSTGKADTSR